MRVPARRMNAYAGMPDERVRAKYYDRMPRPDGIRQRAPGANMADVMW